MHHNVIRQHITQLRINLIERRCSLNHLFADAMNADVAPVKVTLRVDEGLPCFNQYAVHKLSYPDLADGGGIGVGCFDVEGEEDHGMGLSAKLRICGMRTAEFYAENRKERHLFFHCGSLRLLCGSLRLKFIEQKLDISIKIVSLFDAICLSHEKNHGTGRIFTAVNSIFPIVAVGKADWRPGVGSCVNKLHRCRA